MPALWGALEPLNRYQQGPCTSNVEPRNCETAEPRNKEQKNRGTEEQSDLSLFKKACYLHAALGRGGGALADGRDQPDVLNVN